MIGPRIETFRPDRLARARAAIVIPARDEAERIGPCLDALAAQEGIGDTAIYLCVNNSTDATARFAASQARARGLALMVIEAVLPRGGVGRARRLGHLFAQRHSPRATALLSTDADTVAAPGWLAAMRAALDTAPAVLGRIEGLSDIDAALLDELRGRGAIEDAYLRLSFEFERLLTGAAETALALNTAGGANLGLRREVYRAIGGFRPLTSGEDRDLVERLLAAGHAPLRANGAVVAASMRADGRAPDGMAAKIAARLSGRDAGLDTALAPFPAMLARHLGGGSPARPRRVLSRGEAERDLPRLERCVARLRALPDPQTRRRYLGWLWSRETFMPAEAALPIPIAPEARQAPFAATRPAGAGGW